MSIRFNEYDFRRRVDMALQRVRIVLDNTRMSRVTLGLLARVHRQVLVGGVPDKHMSGR
jgi:hypothetical protein